MLKYMDFFKFKYMDLFRVTDLGYMVPDSSYVDNIYEIGSRR